MTAITLEDLVASQIVETADSQLVINMPKQKLPVGKHNFNLTVEDDSGNQSQAALITVIIVDKTAPTAVVDLHDDQGRTVIDGRIAFGSGFMLSGKRSSDVGGKVAKYIWEIVQQ